jgi:glycosyltransferase involved in cell wall biosynthesis
MAVRSPATSRRTVTVSADLLRRTPAAGELLVHALAQVPDQITAHLPATNSNRGQLELLASAYGIRERVSFGLAENADRLVDPLLAGEVPFAELVEGLSENAGAPRSLRGNDEVFRGHRIGVVTNVPAHYRVPLLNAIASRLQAADGRFRVFFCAQDIESRPWLAGVEPLKFEHKYLRSVAVPVRARAPLVPLGIEAALRAFRPTIVLSAGFSPTTSGRVARYARRERIAYAVWSGEHEQMRTARSRLRTAQRRQLLARASCAIVYGSASARYIRLLAPALPTVIGRNTAPLPRPATAARQPGEPVELVAIGDLADARKGIDIAIDALRARPEIECRLTVIGGGAGLPELRKKTSGDHRIELVGPRPAEETRRALSRGDIFLFPTRSDIFGLALVEAMGAGVCAVVSPAAGAVADLCIDRTNCLVVAEQKPERWADTISELVTDAALRQTLGTRARMTILRRWTIEHAADAMIAGLRLAVLTGSGS